jgi:acetyl-CoA carboxylase carboxyltransferase component
MLPDILAFSDSHPARASLKSTPGLQNQPKSSAYHATSELWDDGIIDPADTRKVLGIALSASLHKEFGETPHGVLRI